MRTVRVSLYFMWEWWDLHFARPRPERASDSALCDMYLGRKRWLFERFGRFGVGEETPGMDGRYVNAVLRWGMDFIPHVLGAELACQEAGGYAARTMDEGRLKGLKPVRLSECPDGEWIVKRKRELLARYGSVSQAFDIEGPVNVAVRLRGPAFYVDLIDNPAMADGLLGVIAETIAGAFVFLHREFGLDTVTLANCNVTMMSPALYGETALRHDIRLASLAPKLTGRENAVNLHHCDVPVDRFVPVYSRIPGVGRLEASYRSDIQSVLKAIPGARFAAMVSPLDLLHAPLPRLEADLDRALAAGADEFDLWNIDPGCGPEQLAAVFDAIVRCCERHSARAGFDAVPFCWDELEWAFPRYQAQR